MLAQAAKGIELPSWDTVQALVLACGERPEDWQDRYIRAGGRIPQISTDLRTAVEIETTQSDMPAVDLSFDPMLVNSDFARIPKEMSPRVYSKRASTRGTVIALSLLCLALGITWAAVLTREGSNRDSVILVVENKVAAGPDGWFEDPSGPAYLSTNAISHCASRGCKILGTEMATGDVFTAICVTHGPRHE